MRSRVTYEWDIETVDPETDDILDHHHADRLRDLPALTTDQRLVLVRDVHKFEPEFNHSHGLVDRSWAYVDHAMLPAQFSYDDKGAELGAKVPKRFHKEIASVAARLGI